MKFLVSPSNLKGQAHIPGSKSNTTRAVIIATLAEGMSTIRNPVASTDCLTTVQVCKRIGAGVELGEVWKVTGQGKRPEVPDDVLHMGNSGTTYYIMTGTACLINGYSLITGDYQIRRRPAQPLIDALNHLGGQVFSTRNTGTAPLVAKGVIKGGKAKLPGILSQWLSSLLLNCPLGERDTEIEVENLHERPYIELTLGWLSRQGIEFKNDEFKRFKLRGGQFFTPFDETLPSDWESACFPLVAAAITDSDITLLGMDIQDVQGDKVIVDILKEMGADIEVKEQGKGGIRVRGGKSQELTKMGAKIEESRDSLTIYASDLRGTLIDGHHDHRIVMATAVAGLIAEGDTLVDHAEYAKISFPTFYEVMKGLGADIKFVEGIER